MRALYEWVNPIINLGSGAYPFRTGISAIRIAIHGVQAEQRRRRSAADRRDHHDDDQRQLRASI